MLNKKAESGLFSILIFLALIVFPDVSLGEAKVRYGSDIRKRTPVRYGAGIKKQTPVRYGVEIKVEDIRLVEPDEIVLEDTPSDFQFDMRNYVKVSGYYDDLIKWPDINAGNILELEDTAYFTEVNTNIELSYLENYILKADISYQYSPGSDEQSDRDTHFITNEFYFDISLAQLAFLKVGKKRESWGVGWTFSPIDNIIDLPKNVVDPSESRGGMYLSMLEVPVADLSIRFVYFPYVEFDLATEKGQSGIFENMFDKQAAYGVNASFMFWDTDMSLIYYCTDKIPGLQKDYGGLTLSRYWLDLGAYFGIEAHKGSDLEVVQRTPTGQYYFPVDDALVDLKNNDDDIYVNFAVGANYTFSDNTKIALEYFRNDEGYSDDKFDDFVDFIDYDAGIYLNTQDETTKKKLLKATQILSDKLRKNYLSLSFDRPYTFDDFTPHLGTIICLDDGSFMLNGMLAYNVRDDTTITLDVKGYVGNDDTEWGLKPDNFRVFLSAEYYF